MGENRSYMGRNSIHSPGVLNGKEERESVTAGNPADLGSTRSDGAIR